MHGSLRRGSPNLLPGSAPQGLSPLLFASPIPIIAALRGFKGHKAGVLCHDWHPYMTSLAATGSADTLLMVRAGTRVGTHAYECDCVVCTVCWWGCAGCTRVALVAPTVFVVL